MHNKRHTQETKDRISKTKRIYPTLTGVCSKCSIKFEYRPDKWHPVRKYCSAKCMYMAGGRKGSPLSKESKINLSKRYIGEGNPSWRGGVSKDRKRQSYEEQNGHKIWRKAVFERDNYTCVNCNKKGCYIEADHIKPWARFKELRFDVSNGQTLCKKCHGIKTSLELRIYWKNQYGSSMALRQSTENPRI